MKKPVSNDDFVGVLSEYNPVSLVWDHQWNGYWNLQSNMNVDEYIANPDSNDYYLDYQQSQDQSVCFDPDAQPVDIEDYPWEWDHNGMRATTSECLDGQTVPEPAKPPTHCDTDDAYLNLVGNGTFDCRSHEKKNGTVHKCKVICANGRRARGPRTTRCKTWVKNGKAIGVWYTRKNRMMRCKGN